MQRNPGDHQRDTEQIHRPGHVIVGVRALLVHALHEHARAFYANFDFEPSPTDPLHLLLLTKDARALLEQ